MTKQEPIAMKKVSRKVTLIGITPILFDRYAGNNKEQLAVMDKVYLSEGKMVLPSINILSFLSAQNTESAPQRVIGRGYKEVCKAALSYVQIHPMMIPITRNGKPLTLENADLKVHSAIARVMKGKLSVPNPKERPLLENPWEITFDLDLYETQELNEVLLKKLFERGGLAIGLGTFRGVFGKFYVSEWK
jgi:hypothetical protein